MRRESAWRGAAAGLAGGLAATLVMTGFQTAWGAAAKKLSSNQGSNGTGTSGAGASSNSENGSQAESQNPTVKVAQKIVSVAGQELTPEKHETAGRAVHYGFGTLMGAVYGSAVEFAPRRYRRSPVRSGLMMGSALFVAADEIALPALQLTEGPTKTPPSSHIYGLVSHLVYGITAGLVTRAVRNAI
jgi:putative membrane protein